MNILVTGADGLLGSHLVRGLLERKANVRVFVQPQSDSPTLDGLPIERIKGDLAEDNGGLDDAVKGCQTVFHCAATTNLWADKELVWKINYEGTRKILDACKKQGVERLVFVGSASSFQFGSRETPGNEQGLFPDAYRGLPYMESKHRAMKLVWEYVENQGLNAVVVAPTFMLGDHDFRPSSGELVRQFVHRKLKFAPPGGRNFAHAKDVAQAMIAAMDHGAPGQSYILGGVNLTYLDFFSQVAQVAGLAVPKWLLPKSLVTAAGWGGSLWGAVTRKPVRINRRIAAISLLDTYYSSQKAIDELGLQQTPIRIAIEESIECLKTYGQLR